MKNKKYKQVTHEEYITFIKNYPNKLDFDCVAICDPPLGTYNDFTNGDVWPASVVAKEIRRYLGQNGERDDSCPGKYWEYFILCTE